MIVLKVATIFLLALAVRAEKKIELQDIEEDNLRSEKESEVENSDARPQNSAPGTGPGLVPLEYLKSGILRYFENPTPAPQQQRYVHQYAVTEPPERPPPPPVATVQYTPQTAPQQVVGYLSNVPMQVYLVPQYYTDQSHQPVNHHSPHVQYQPTVARVAAYQTAPEAVQTQTNYVQVPSYVTPTGKTYVQQYTPPVTYVGYQGHPTIAPAQPTVAPVVTYQVPVAIEYTPTVVQPTTAPKQYYQHHQYTETNSVDEPHDHHEDDQRQYSTQTEVPYHKPASDFPRHYNSRVPIREDYRPHPNAITELPHPNPLIFKSPPPHLAHVPKALPVYRPIQRPVYQPAASHVSGGYTPRPHEVYGPPSPFKRRPTSLLDSYIPSSVQVEYLKRGLIKDPLAVYDALTSGRLPHPIPRNYERGFLPNQMYHIGAGGVTFGHYKRTPKVDKIPHN